MRWIRATVVLMLMAASLRWIPSAWCGREASALWADDIEMHRELARGNDRWRAAELAPSDFMTDSARFDGEWRFGTSMMAASSRAHEDEGPFASLWPTTYLFGAPVVREGARNFAFGGPLGDAMMVALLTARPLADWSDAS